MAIETKTLGDVTTVTTVSETQYVPLTTEGGNVTKIKVGKLLKSGYMDAMIDLFAPQYTLEQTTATAFEVTNKDGAVWNAYRNKMGGYMLLTKDGKTYAAKLNRTDWNSFADGTDATAAAALCETMVRVPKCYYKASGQSMKLYGLTEAADSEAFDSPEWVGAYEMYVDSAGKGHSRPDVSPAHSKTMSAFWSCAQLLGTDWGLANYGFHKLINALFQCGYGNLNSQAAVGSGGQTSSWEAWRDVATGYGRTLGDGSGAAATSMSGQSCVKLFGFEDLWAKLWEFRPGIRFYYDSSAGKRYAVEYGGNIVSNTASGRTFEIPVLNAGGGYVTKMTLGEHWDMTPKAVGGGETTGYADGYWDNTSGQLLYVGGAAGYGARCGVSFASSGIAFSDSWTSVGARLAFYGQPEIVSGSELVALAGAS